VRRVGISCIQGVVDDILVTGDWERAARPDAAGQGNTCRQSVGGTNEYDIECHMNSGTSCGSYFFLVRWPGRRLAHDEEESTHGATTR
jgi:hypothetical protein